MQNHTTMKTILASRVKEEVNDWLSTGKRLIPILLFAFLTLGFGQAWADNGDFYNASMSYKFGNADWAWIEDSDNGTGQSRTLGTLSSGTFIVGDVYLKCWDDWGSNFKSEGGQMIYTNKGGSEQYLTGFTRSDKSGNNYDYHKTGCDLTIASYDDASGSYALVCWYQTWGWGDRYFPKSSGNYTLNYKIAPPAVNEGNNFTVTPSNLISGTGTSSDPFVIAYGSTTTFKVTATKHHTDANSKLKVSWNNGSSWSTGSTATTTELTSSAFTPDGTQRSITIKVKFNNYTASLDGAVSSRTIHYIQQTPGLTVAAGSHGKVRKATGDSWTTSALISPVAAGTAYYIYAKADDYYDFSSWSSSDATHTTFGSSTSTSTTATLSAGYGAVTTVTASFVEHPYTITIVGGTAGSTTAKVATIGTATAKAPFGMHFTGWTVPASNFTLVGCTTSDATITFNATANGTVTANFAQTHAYIEGRFHVTNASRNGSWTNTFANNDDDSWEEASRSIEFSYDTENHYYYLHTYAKPSELTSNISNQVPWFFIKSSPSTANWTGVTVNRPHASGDSNQQLTADGDANKKLADATSGTNSFRFNSSDESGYVVIGFKEFSNKPYIYYWLEQTLEYSGNGNTGGSAPASKTYYNKGTSVQAAANSYTKSGYTFTGWNTKANGSGSAVAASGWYTLNANTTFYARWSEDNYTVIVQAGEHGSVASGSVTGHKDTKVTLPTATADPGYYFTGWTRVSGSTVTWTNQSSATAAQVNDLTSGVTVRANFAPLWTLKGGKTGQSDWSLDAHIFTSYVVNDQSHNEGQQSFTLDPNTTYRIKLRNRQTSSDYGLASGAATTNVYYATSNNWWVMTNASGNQNLIVNTASGGTYNFYWDINDNELFILYPTSWYITTGQSDALGGSFTAVDNSSNNVKGGKFVANDATVTFTANKNTGYTFDGWFYNADYDNAHKYVDNDADINLSGTDNKVLTLSSIEEDKAAYAKFTAKTYTVTLTRSGTGYGSGGTASVTATYNQTLPAATMPTAAQGYAFMGYYTAADGEGSQLVAANGTWQNVAGYTSGGKWIRDGGAELFAYFKKGAISALTLDAAIVAQGNTVGITPTLDPIPVGDKVICWRVLHGNGNPLDDQPAFSWNGTKVTFPASTNSGTYLAEAILRKGTTCGGEVLDSVTVSFQVAGDHTVTVQYKCGDDFIQASTSVTGKPLEWTSITAPNIFGYTFSKWKAGDGITIDGADGSGEKASATINFKATYEGKLTAIYTQKQLIYFKNTLGWSNVYVNFYTVSYWNNPKGSGNKDVTNRNKHMTRLDDTDIWYYDYGAASITPSKYVSFTSASQTNAENFWASNPGVNVVYPANYQDDIHTDKSSENGFKAATPMFVPIAGQTATVLNSVNNGKANYFNRGYWVQYTPGTGYTLEIYNSAGTQLLKSVAFTSDGDLMPMEATVDLEAGQTYKYQLRRGGESAAGVYYGNSNTMTYNNCTSWEMINTMSPSFSKAGINANAAGEYKFTLNYAANASSQYRLRMTVKYPVSMGDFRIVYSDNDTWSRGVAHSLGTWIMKSHTITARANGIDTVSFFISKDHSPEIRWEKATSQSGTAITWGTKGSWLTTGYTDVSESAVYNFKVTQNANGTEISSIERIGKYTGDYYIRVDCANSKWDNYTVDPDHRMTYSEYSIDHGGYSHYYCHWVQTDDRKNVKFCIANDYSPSISDTLTREVASGEWANIGSFINEGGDILRNANVRFMWNQSTNKISRAYIDGAQGPGSNNFLKMLSSDSKIKDLSGTPKTEVYFQDNENWIYETNIQAKPNAQYKLVSNWGTGTVITQYFKGTSSSTETLITGSGEIWYVIRVIYDFKTNRILAAWMPEGELEEAKEINADVMFIREHQGDINQLILNDAGTITDIKTAYGVMRFNKYTINNKEKTGSHQPLASPASIYERSLYWVSFPFRVKLSEVFGFGTYGTHWILQYYDGAARAEKGMWAETGSYWKFIWDRKDFILEPNTGYLLTLETELMSPESSVWGPESRASQVELFFPSYGTMPDITQDNVVISLEEHTCTINRSGGNLPGGNDYRTTYDRRIVDSHWNVMGVPTYVNTDDVTFPASEWTTNLPKFLYTWNSDDNTITAASASGFTFHAMHAYMVQYYGNVTWSAHSGSPYPIVARSTYSEKPKEVEFCIELTQNETMLDRTFINLSDDETVSAGFAFNEDMTKEFSGNKPAIYTFIDTDVVAAGNTLPMSDQKTIVPLGVETKQAGDYTIAIPNGTNGVGVTLIDEETGVHTSLSALDYTVSLPAGKHDNRFFLEISPIKTTPTGIENQPTSDSSLKGRAQKKVIDGILYIVKDGKIFDARGARLR